jgi:HSP20 family protein
MSDRNRHISFRSDRNVRPSGRLWNPAADVYRTRDGWTVKIDLAGVRPDELEIEVADRSLRVRGCRRDSFYQEGFTYHQMEITYSRFEKSIQFPCSIQGASLQREYRDGLLIIVLRSDFGSG